MDDLNRIREDFKKFIDERDWNQFHSPKNIAMALSVEASEIVEIFQWLDQEESYNLDSNKIQKLKDEIGDVFLYLQLLTSKYDLDMLEVAKSKLEKNIRKYPVEKAKGSAKKYSDL